MNKKITKFLKYILSAAVAAVLLYFSFREVDWQDFIVQYLVKELGVIHVVAGHDFHFGYMGKGNPDRLKAKCAELGVGCDIIGRVEQDGITISSTYIRTLIAQGEMERAREFLGHPHILSGTVVHGRKLGRTLGIPTANLRIPEGLAVPRFGVYACSCIAEGKRYPAVTNIGTRPTVEGHHITVEPWILDYEGDLYDREIILEFHYFLRPEMKFPSLEALQAEIRKNAEETRQYLQQR